MKLKSDLNKNIISLTSFHFSFINLGLKSLTIEKKITFFRSFDKNFYQPNRLQPWAPPWTTLTTPDLAPDQEDTNPDLEPRLNIKVLEEAMIELQGKLNKKSTTLVAKTLAALLEIKGTLHLLEELNQGLEGLGALCQVLGESQETLGQKLVEVEEVEEINILLKVPVELETGLDQELKGIMIKSQGPGPDRPPKKEEEKLNEFHAGQGLKANQTGLIAIL